MKVRNMKGATLFNPRIYFESLLNNSTMKCESRDEANFLIDLEFNNSVKRFVTQPKSFMYEYLGKVRRYTADVGVEYIDGSIEMFELKHTRYANTEGLHEKIAHISGLLTRYHNSKLTLVTSADIDSDPSHVTRKILYKYKSLNVDESVKKSAIRALYKSEMTIKALECLFTTRGASRASAWAFMAQHFSSIKFFGDSNISPNTSINWSKSL